MLCAKGNLLDAAAKYRKRKRSERETDRQTDTEKGAAPHAWFPLWSPMGPLPKKEEKYEK